MQKIAEKLMNINIAKPSLKNGIPFRNILWCKRSWFQRFWIVLIVIALVAYAQAVAISDWYINKHKNEPLNFGVTFISDYASFLGTDPKVSFKALRDDMGIHRFRLVTYMSDVEPQRGVYDFSDIDWQLQMISQVHGSATVAIGLRQPRWPECHLASWASGESVAQRNSDVDAFIKATVSHLKQYPVVQSYQLENEYFLGVFGACPASSRTQLINEFNIAKSADPKTPIIMSLANNYFGIPIGQPRPDEFGVSVYKRVFDYTVTKRYFEYPFTPRYYAYRAGLTQMFTGRESMLHELQVEPWTATGYDIRTAPLSEEYKSMNPKIAASRIQYGINTGFRDIDMWGGEWWYYLKTVRHDPAIWNAVQGALDKARATEGAH